MRQPRQPLDVICDVTPMRADAQGLYLVDDSGREFLAAHTRANPDDFGQRGMVIPAEPEAGRDEVAFYVYADQSLQRLPALDTPLEPYLGWRCDARPEGFTAPCWCVPGEDGRVVEYDARPLTVDVPLELRELAQRFRCDPAEIFEQFISDLSCLSGPSQRLRADTQLHAMAWMERAFGARV